MRTLLIHGGHVVDPATGVDAPRDVLLADEQIAAVVAPGHYHDQPVHERIDATGCIVTPGLIDMQVHLGEPGNEKAETVVTGARAAVAGGFTTIACTPDTDPPIDSEAAAEHVYLAAGRANSANVVPIGCLTKGRRGEELAEMGQLADAGAVAFSDADRPVANASLLSKALRYASMFDRAVFQLPLEPTLSTGVMNHGFPSARLGMDGIPAAAEEVQIARDIILARDAGVRLHIPQVTTSGGIELIRRAKADGVAVTCSVTPHHLTLTDDLLERYDASAHKVLPPLRDRAHIDALLTGLTDGTIDAIATDHWPQAPEDKQREFARAPWGVVGLETAVSLLYDRLVQPGVITMWRLVELLSTAPAQILSLPDKGTLRRGAHADITILDPAHQWTVDPERFYSKSRNTPFAGWTFNSRPHTTIVMGRPHRPHPAPAPTGTKATPAVPAHPPA